MAVWSRAWSPFLQCFPVSWKLQPWCWRNFPDPVFPSSSPAFCCSSYALFLTQSPLSSDTSSLFQAPHTLYSLPSLGFTVCCPCAQLTRTARGTKNTPELKLLANNTHCCHRHFGKLHRRKISGHSGDIIAPRADGTGRVQGGMQAASKYRLQALLSLREMILCMMSLHSLPSSPSWLSHKWHLFLQVALLHTFFQFPLQPLLQP